MFPKPKTENKCMCMFETNKKMCAYKRSYNRAALPSVFSLGFLTLSRIGGVYINALLQPYSKHLPINTKKLPLKEIFLSFMKLGRVKINFFITSIQVCIDFLLC